MNRVIMKKKKQRESIFLKPINEGDKRERKKERKKKRKDIFAQSKKKISIEAIVIVEKRSSNRQQSSFFSNWHRFHRISGKNEWYSNHIKKNMRKKYHINSSFMLALCVILTQTKDFQRNPTFLGLSGKKWHSNFLCDIFFKLSLSFVKTKKKSTP